MTVNIEWTPDQVILIKELKRLDLLRLSFHQAPVHESDSDIIITCEVCGETGEYHHDEEFIYYESRCPQSRMHS